MYSCFPWKFCTSHKLSLWASGKHPRCLLCEWVLFQILIHKFSSVSIRQEAEIHHIPGREEFLIDSLESNPQRGHMFSRSPSVSYQVVLPAMSFFTPGTKCLKGCCWKIGRKNLKAHIRPAPIRAFQCKFWNVLTIEYE